MALYAGSILSELFTCHSSYSCPRCQTVGGGGGGLYHKDMTRSYSTVGACG